MPTTFLNLNRPLHKISTDMTTLRCDQNYSIRWDSYLHPILTVKAIIDAV